MKVREASSSRKSNSERGRVWKRVIFRGRETFDGLISASAIRALPRGDRPRTLEVRPDLSRWGVPLSPSVARK